MIPIADILKQSGIARMSLWNMESGLYDPSLTKTVKYLDAIGYDLIAVKRDINQ